MKRILSIALFVLASIYSVVAIFAYREVEKVDLKFRANLSFFMDDFRFSPADDIVKVESANSWLHRFSRGRELEVKRERYSVIMWFSGVTSLILFLLFALMVVARR